MANGVTPQELAKSFGNDIFELTRRRFANQFATQRNQQRSQFATRGRAGSSASAFAGRELEREQARQLAESSLTSQLAGQDLGFRESERREGIRRFDEDLGFRRAGLAQNEALTRAGFANQLELARVRGMQELERLRFLEEIQGKNQFGSLLGSLAGGLGGLIPFTNFGMNLFPGLRPGAGR